MENARIHGRCAPFKLWRAQLGAILGFLISTGAFFTLVGISALYHQIATHDRVLNDPDMFYSKGVVWLIGGGTLLGFLMSRFWKRDRNGPNTRLVKCQ